MVLANTFEPDTRVRREAKSLADKGFRVGILCWDRVGRRPSRELLDNCSVRNVRLGRATVLATSKPHYMIAAVVFQAIAFLQITMMISRVRGVVVHAHDFNTLLACSVARRLFGNRIRLVYDCHELTPGAYQEWYGPSIAKIVTRLERLAILQVDGIVAANDAILDYLLEDRHLNGKAIYSCPTIKDIPNVTSAEAKKKLGLENLFVVLFSGWVRQDYDFDAMWAAARDLKQEHVSNVRFVFIGPQDTTTSIVNAVNYEGLREMFEFRGWVSFDSLLLYYVASDLCFAVGSSRGPNTKVLTPVKMFESMACGVPVAVRDGTLGAEIVKQWRCGVIVGSGQKSFSSELTRLRGNTGELRALGEAGRIAFRSEYNWEAMEERLLQLYAEL
jgi:glycosyltransferase involved in cell wall biosynthesis